MFYGTMNIAFINSYVIYCHKVLSKLEKSLNRGEYIKKPSSQPTTAWMIKRLDAPTLPRRVRDNIENIIPKPNEQVR